MAATHCCLQQSSPSIIVSIPYLFFLFILYFLSLTFLFFNFFTTIIHLRNLYKRPQKTEFDDDDDKNDIEIQFPQLYPSLSALKLSLSKFSEKTRNAHQLNPTRLTKTLLLELLSSSCPKLGAVSVLASSEKNCDDPVEFGSYLGGENDDKETKMKKKKKKKRRRKGKKKLNGSSKSLDLTGVNFGEGKENGLKTEEVLEMENSKEGEDKGLTNKEDLKVVNSGKVEENGLENKEDLKMVNSGKVEENGLKDKEDLNGVDYREGDENDLENKEDLKVVNSREGDENGLDNKEDLKVENSEEGEENGIKGKDDLNVVNSWDGQENDLKDKEDLIVVNSVEREENGLKNKEDLRVVNSVEVKDNGLKDREYLKVRNSVEVEENILENKEDLESIYPVTSLNSATQRRIKQQYEQLIKSQKANELTPAKITQFADCLAHARKEIQQKSDCVKRKFTITKALLMKADRSSFERLHNKICKIELEQKRLEEDAEVYNVLRRQLRNSPAYKKVMKCDACSKSNAKSHKPPKKLDTEKDNIISFEEFLEQEKKDTFWQNYGKLKSSSR